MSVNMITYTHAAYMWSYDFTLHGKMFRETSHCIFGRCVRCRVPRSLRHESSDGTRIHDRNRIWRSSHEKRPERSCTIHDSVHVHRHDFVKFLLTHTIERLRYYYSRIVEQKIHTSNIVFPLDFPHKSFDVLGLRHVNLMYRYFDTWIRRYAFVANIS